MTYDEFHARVVTAHETQQFKGELRLGQIYFNMLRELKPSIAEQLRGSMLDPFFKERINKVTSDFVRERW